VLARSSVPPPFRSRVPRTWRTVRLGDACDYVPAVGGSLGPTALPNYPRYPPRHRPFHPSREPVGNGGRTPHLSISVANAPPGRVGRSGIGGMHVIMSSVLILSPTYFQITVILCCCAVQYINYVRCLALAIFRRQPPRCQDDLLRIGLFVSNLNQRPQSCI